MDNRSKSLRVGISAILLSLLLRLGAAGVLNPRNLAVFLNQMETGRNVRFSPSLAANLTFPAESPGISWEAPPLPHFDSLSDIEIKNLSGKEADLISLLTAPLRWDLLDGETAVLILSTHTTESYTKNGEDYVESSSWRTLDGAYNMLSIGRHLGELLEEAGIRVIRDESLHDYPSYNGSYTHARGSMKELLSKYPTVRLVLDLHRDASDAAFGQLRTAVDLEGGTTAQIMPVMGTNHDHWQENLALALKLMAQLESQAPGITRPLLLRQSRFNQDLSPGALLLEMGAAGNTHQEALRAAEQLARAIIALARGTE